MNLCKVQVGVLYAKPHKKTQKNGKNKNKNKKVFISISIYRYLSYLCLSVTSDIIYVINSVSGEICLDNMIEI